MAMGFGLGGDGLRYDVSPDALSRIGLSVTDLDELTEDFVKEYQKYESLFEEMSRD
jgi:hypothetical protein